MPLILKVGVSRKVSADFQSRGFTLDIQSEFDPRTLDNTNTLADAADHLFQLANNLLEHQVRKAGEDGDDRTPPLQPTAQASTRTRQAVTRNGGNGNRPNGKNYNGGDGRGRGQTNGSRPITDAQVRAVTNMATRLRVDPDTFAGQTFNRGLNELTLREGSDLIDMLKQEIEAGPQDQNGGASR